MSSKFTIVTNEVPESLETLYISSENRDYPYIAYRDNTGRVVSVYEGSSVYRPIHCSEFLSILNSCGSMMGGLGCVIPGSVLEVDDLYYLPPILNPANPSIPVLPKITLSARERGEVNTFSTSGLDTGKMTSDWVNAGIKACDDWGSLVDVLTERINELYATHIGKGNSTSGPVGLYSADPLEDTMVLSLISPTTYTDTVDLNGVIENISYPGITSKLDISIDYSDGEKIFSITESFEPFRYLDTGDLFVPEIFITLEDIRVDYIDGVIRVFPIKQEITECIISDCTITYGNIITE